METVPAVAPGVANAYWIDASIGSPRTGSAAPKVSASAAQAAEGHLSSASRSRWD